MKLAAPQPQTEHDHVYDCSCFEEQEEALHVAASAGAQAIDGGQGEENRGGNGAVATGRAADLAKIFGEGDSDGGHAAGLRYQKEDPAVEKSDAGMISLAQVEILA